MPSEQRKLKTTIPRAPLTGYEHFASCVPGLRKAARQTARLARSRLTDPGATIHPEDLSSYTPADDFIHKFARRELRRRCELGEPHELARESAIAMAELVGAHLRYAANHELHRRKVFWVDEALSYMLLNTELDVPGACLKLPFPSFCVMFDDAPTLGLAHDFLDTVDNCDIAGQPLASLSVYATRHEELGDEREQIAINFSFVFKSTQDPWPYLIARDLCFGPGDSLDEILRSHANDASDDAVFGDETLVELVHLVVNVILYTTSAQFEGQTLRPPKARERRRSGATGPRRSNLEVVHLPGKIDISALRETTSQMDRSEQKSIIAKRFMVRGHWRRANPSWADQRLRWIEPYWKGPELATIIEQEYRARL